MRKSKTYEKAVKDAYNVLVTFRKRLEERNEYDFAKDVESIYKNLWCECLDEEHPWK